MAELPDKNGIQEEQLETRGNQSPRDSSEEKEKSESKNDSESNHNEKEESKEEFIEKVDSEKAIEQSKNPE